MVLKLAREVDGGAWSIAQHEDWASKILLLNHRPALRGMDSNLLLSIVALLAELPSMLDRLAGQEHGDIKV